MRGDFTDDDTGHGLYFAGSIWTGVSLPTAGLRVLNVRTANLDIVDEEFDLRGIRKTVEV